MASKRTVDATKRRMALERELQDVAKLEAEQQIEAALQSNMQYKKLQRDMKKLAKSLHDVRVNLSRKVFGIKVRNERLVAIPKEIAQIEVARVKVQNQLDRLERKQQKLNAAISAVKDQVASSLVEHVAA